MLPNEAKLLDLLKNNDVTFFIPPYQRNYEWTDEQCKVFLDDVMKTCELNQAGIVTEHFFGSVTFFKTETAFGQPDRLVLIDGQQRITTTMLFLVALRDIINDSSIKNYIDSKYLRNDNVTDETEYKIKLKQVETDWATYKNLILHEEMSDTEKSACVYKNYQYFYNKITSMELDDPGLQKLIEKGLSKFSVVTIELQPDKNKWENPQEIFESMNSLGKPLSLADLVRNYILLGLNPDTQATYYKKYWLHIERSTPQQVSNFIRDYMQAKSARSFKQATGTNDKELYGQFKELFAKKEAEELLNDLSGFSTIYSYIAFGKPSGSKKIDRILSDLRKVAVTTSYSFLLMLLFAWKNDDFTETDIINILEVFKIYTYRRRIVGLNRAENKFFPTLITQISNLIDSDNKQMTMFDILSSQDINMRLPNDNEMRREIETKDFYNFKYCAFFLSLIEEKITKSRPDLSDTHLQVEHIMPRTLSDDWKNQLGEDADRIHEDYINTIGNLTLIRHNQEIGNKRFAYKKDFYENKAGLQIAKTKITNCEKWSEKEIKERAEWLIDYLLNNIFPIPEKKRKVNNYITKDKKGAKTKSLHFFDLQLIGESINFIGDPATVAHVVDDKHVEFEGKKWRLSPLTKEILIRKGRTTIESTSSFQGAQYWEYDEIRLSDIL